MRALALALVLWAGAAEAQVMTDAAGLREIAARLLAQGDAEQSADMARALLARNPDDRVALILLAAAAPQAGDPAEGRRAAQRAWSLSEQPAERFEAARLAARAALAEGRPLLAEVWLRLALAAAPSEELEARALEDGRTLRALSPWRIEAELSLAPSSNVNDGSDSDWLEVDGLVIGFPGGLGISIDGQALSGWVGTTDLRATRRLSESQVQRTELRFRLSGRVVALSGESSDRIREAGLEDEVTGADFGSAAAEVGVGHRRNLGWGLAGGDAVLGWSHSGDEDDPINDASVWSLRATGFGVREIGNGQVLRLSGNVESRWSDNPAREQERVGIEAAWILPVLGDDRLTLAASRSLVLSDNFQQASDSWGMQATYALGEAVGPARLSFTAGASWTEYPDYRVFGGLFGPIPGGRRDERVYARAEAEFGDWSFAGFAPVLSLDAERADSNVSRFDTESLGVGITLRSTF
jgi:hypothetical protein